MTTGQPQGQQQQQFQAQLDTSKMSVTFMNHFEMSQFNDLLVLDCATMMPLPMVRTEGGQPVFTFAVGSRVLMNFAVAKQMAIGLANLVRRFEEQYGEIKLPPAQGGPGGGGTNGGPRLAN